MLQENPIEFKSHILTFLVLYIKNQDPDIIKQSILKKIQKYPSLFNQYYIILNVSRLNRDVNWLTMRKAIFSTGLRILGIYGHINNTLREQIIKSGIPIFEEKSSVFNMNNNFFKKNKIQNNTKSYSKIIYDTVRSGQKIYSENQDLIIINNVNTGAELICTENIHVYGTMRGRILAGVNGNTNKIIFCTKFFAELVSISGEYLLIDQISPKILGKSVYIFLNNNILSIKLLS